MKERNILISGIIGLLAVIVIMGIATVYVPCGEPCADTRKEIYIEAVDSVMRMTQGYIKKVEKENKDLKEFSLDKILTRYEFDSIRVALKYKAKIQRMEMEVIFRKKEAILIEEDFKRQQEHKKAMEKLGLAKSKENRKADSLLGVARLARSKARLDMLGRSSKSFVRYESIPTKQQNGK